MHYACSKLPPYQLYLYETTQRRYTCEACTQMDEDYQIHSDTQTKDEQLQRMSKVEMEEANGPAIDTLETADVQKKQTMSEPGKSDTELNADFKIDEGDLLREPEAPISKKPLETSDIEQTQESSTNDKSRETEPISPQKANWEQKEELNKDEHIFLKETEGGQASQSMEADAFIVKDIGDGKREKSQKVKSMKKETMGNNGQAGKENSVPAKLIDTKDKEPAYSENSKMIDVNMTRELESFKKTTVDMLQESFVNSFDQINNSIREMSCTQSDTEKLQTQVKVLKETNEKLKLQMANNQINHPTDKDCTKCSEYIRKIASLKKDLENSTEKAKDDIYNHKLQVEVQESKFNAEIKMLRQKENSMSRTISMLESDIVSLEKRLDGKSQLIVDLEQNISKLNLKISNLQDTIFETKSQSYCNGEQFQVVTKTSRLELTDQITNHSDSTEEECRKNRSQEATEPNNSLNSELTRREVEVEDMIPLNGRKNITEVKKSKGKSQMTVEVIGTSNTKNLSVAYIGEKEFHVSKVIKYTIQQTKDYVASMKIDNAPNVMVLHPLCNEIELKSPEICTEEVDTAIKGIEDKFKDMKIILSLGLPRADETLNRKIEKTNILLKERLDNRGNVFFCDNTNLFYRGQAQRGVLKDDGLHLTNIGTRKLGRNLKEALWDIFDLPIITAEQRNDDRDINTGDQQQQHNGDSDQQQNSKRTGNSELSVISAGSQQQQGIGKGTDDCVVNPVVDDQKQQINGTGGNLNDGNLSGHNQEPQMIRQDSNYAGNQSGNINQQQRNGERDRFNTRDQPDNNQQQQGDGRQDNNNVGKQPQHWWRNGKQDGYYAGNQPGNYRQQQRNGTQDDNNAENQSGYHGQQQRNGRRDDYAGHQPGDYGQQWPNGRQENFYAGNQPGDYGQQQQRNGRRDNYNTGNLNWRWADYYVGNQPDVYGQQQRIGRRHDNYTGNHPDEFGQQQRDSRRDDYYTGNGNGRRDDYYAGNQPGNYGQRQGNGKRDDYNTGSRKWRRDDYYAGNQPGDYGRQQRYGRQDDYYAGNQPGYYGQQQRNRRRDNYNAGNQPGDYGHRQQGGRRDDYYAGNQPGDYGQQQHYGRRDNYYAGNQSGDYGHQQHGGRRDDYYAGNQPGDYGQQQRNGRRDDNYTRNHPGDYGHPQHGGRRDDYYAGNQSGDYGQQQGNGRRDGYYAGKQSGDFQQRQWNGKRDNSYNGNQYGGNRYQREGRPSNRLGFP